jgi:hypothetical protein
MDVHFAAVIQVKKQLTMELQKYLSSVQMKTQFIGVPTPST